MIIQILIFFLHFYKYKYFSCKRGFGGFGGFWGFRVTAGSFGCSVAAFRMERERGTLEGGDDHRRGIGELESRRGDDRARAKRSVAPHRKGRALARQGGPDTYSGQFT